MLEKIRQDRQKHHEEKLAQKKEALVLLKSLVEKSTKSNDKEK